MVGHHGRDQPHVRRVRGRRRQHHTPQDPLRGDSRESASTPPYDVRGSTNSDRNTTSPECRSIRITNTRLWLKNIGIGHRRSADSAESSISALFQHLRKHTRARRPGPSRRLRTAHRTLSTGPPQPGLREVRTGARQTSPTSNATGWGPETGVLGAESSLPFSLGLAS